MVEIKCIIHNPICHRIVLCEDFVAITKTKSAAALLFYFEKRTNKMLFLAKANAQNDNFIPNKMDLGMQCSNKYLRAVMMQEFSENSIRGALIELESLNLISSKRNITSNKGDSATSYFLNIEEVQSQIDNYNLGKYTPSSKLSTPSAKLSTPYSELSTPSSKLSTTNIIKNIIKNSINNKEEIIKENLENFGSSFSVEEIVKVVEKTIKPLNISKEKKVAQKKENIVSLQKTSSEAIIGYYNEVFSKRSLIVDSNISIVLKALNQGYSEDNLRTIIDNVFSQNQNNLEYQWGNSISQIFSCGRDGKIDRNFQYVKKNNNNGTDKKNSELRIGQLHGHDFTKNEFDQAERVARNIEEKRKRHEEVIAKLYS